MANNRIGCSAGKTSLIDPNNFSGQGSSDNISVPLEDLNIAVQLKTFKKGRTILMGDKTVKTSESSQTVAVTFIEGTEVNGQKVLTSKFTDLTTVFDKNNDSSENLGITNIDIDFNSSYAPLITINFLDLRGSSIFQNESQLNNNENKYSVFFQLPYPLYELEIKGYYGQPVKYCLHMTKFNSKFNAQTGNFEITANFVGYTYAMLSDMLLGILKAIPYTSKGIDKYKEAKSINPSLLNLNELSIKITEIDKNVEKLAASNPDAARLKTLKELDGIIDLIRQNINEHGYNVGTSITSKIVIGDYKFMPHLTGSEPSTFYNDTYLKLVTENIIGTDKFNEKGALIGGYYIDLATFTNLGALKYPKITIDKLNDEKVIGLTKQKELANELSTRSSLLVGGYEFDLYDTTSLFDIIDKNKTRLQKDITTTEKNLAISVKNSISTSFGFEPTIRNIVNVFTVAVEVYLSVMFDVSHDAETHPEREAELKSVFNSDKNSDLKLNVATKFYPWPDYRENSGVDGYQEKYLGARGVLKNPDRVDELIFIEDLYQGFLTAKKLSDEALLDLEDETTTWLPSNPFDTLLYNDTEPYSRLGNTATADDVMVFALIRFMTYVAYTNSKGLLADKKLISNFAEIEAKSIIDNKTIPDSSKLILSQQNEGSFIGVKGDATDKNMIANPPPNQVITKLGSQYYYDYIFSLKYSDVLRVLPISGPIVSNVNFINSDYNHPNGNTANETLVVKSYKYNFLTNYSSYQTNFDITAYGEKIIDGGKYIDIISPSTFQSKINGKEFPVDNTKILTLAELKAGTGINILNGVYGITEFKNINLNSTLPDTSIISVFYKDKKFNKTHDYYYEDMNGFSYKRNDNVINMFDLKYNPNNNSSITYNNKRYSPTTQVLFKYGTTNTFPKDDGNFSTIELRKYYGSNRYCIDRLIKGDFNFKYPYIEQEYEGEGINSSHDPQKFSLFGSKLYYLQDKKGNLKEYNRALLFLNTIPWNGNSFESSEILNLFKVAGGFIHAPKLWCAYIGGLLWRADTNPPDYDSRAKIFRGGSGIDDPILWNKSTETIYEVPSKQEHWNVLRENSLFVSSSYVYDNYSELLLTLPVQIKKEFKQTFFDFVNGDSDRLKGITWDDLKNELEIWKGNSDDFYDFINGIYNSLNCTNPIGQLPNFCEVDNVYYKNSTYPNLNTDNYSIITPVSFQNDVRSNGHNMALGLEIDDNSYASVILTKALIEEVVIVNAGYAVWDTPFFSAPTKYNQLVVTEENLNIYIKTMLDKFKGITPELLSKEKELKLTTFGTEDTEVIKFQLYKTCKNVYDKWIGGATDKDNIIFQCGGSTPIRNGLDKEIKNKLRPSDSKERLIDSFRFVTRSFKDIGDEFYIDPRPVNTYLTDNPNSSFYDAVSNLLASNNFDFIPLPSYINYNNPQVMESIFEPYSYHDAISGGTCGPSFVCVYVGQKSKHLDFTGSDYTNDGIDIQCGSDGNMVQKLPSDFTDKNADYENNVAVFKVGFSQQNQNIFKDIILDQSEFTETEESLKIIDDISKTGSENQRHFGGQNLYSVYGVRSYKAEVEMMGNAMIQPMMYFQLDNIPMFHGAYMITHVKHSIKPNFMSTNFTGVRIRFPETPLLKANELYMSLLEGVEITATPTKPGKLLGCSTKPVSPSVKCGLVGKNVISFEEVLSIIIQYLEGAYCSGGYACGDKKSKPPKSGETLWGLDRKNFGHSSDPNFKEFWRLVDKDTKIGWNVTSFPKPKDKPDIYKQYFPLMQARYKTNITMSSLKKLTNYSKIMDLVNNDGRLYLNVVYAGVFNGSGFLEKYFIMLDKAYSEGNITSDELLKIFVDDRIFCLNKSWPTCDPESKVLVANTGVKIGKLVGLYC